MNQHDWLGTLRSQSQCELRDGVWYCKCGLPLAEEGIMCGACAEASRQAHERAERDRRRKEWVESKTRIIERAKSQLPVWPHTQNRQAFEATVSTPVLRKAAEQYTLEKGSGVFLGKSGDGKTSLLIRIAVRLLDEALARVLAMPHDQDALIWMHDISRLVWTTGCNLARASSEHRLGSGGEPELFRRALEAPLLMIDELGPEAPQHGGEIFDLVDRRYAKGRPTLVTSGLTLDKERYGDAFHRRLTESGRGFLIDVHKRRTDG